MKINSILRVLKKYNMGYWGKRMIAQLNYAHELSICHGGKYEILISKAAQDLLDEVKETGVILKEACLKCEESLRPMTSDAKSLIVHAVGHAHIDMNWMWRYDETVNITLETFRTVIKLMEEFPDFTFSQSQASCYRIVEQYDKALLKKIRKMVKLGRWEAVATAWVETDKNMPNGESLARHILYTKRYMKKLFDINEDDLKVDFEPDTFGHNANVPEILAAGGVEYYYHCRGFDKYEIYNWKSASGAEVLVYREPTWYLGPIEPEFFTGVPSFCKRNNVSDMLEVYGVGDHGGGPTRRDLECLTDMMDWPVYPTIVFSSYHRFFETIKPKRKSFPVVDHELNFIFTGCYTSQSRIKAANRIGEAALYEAELFAALSPVRSSVDNSLFEEAWRDVLFSHFHDIIPGSCVIDTREYAMGMFQEVLAKANTQKGIICYALADMIDTSAVGGKSINGTTSEGAGAGYSVEENHNLARIERGAGMRRGYLLFNAAGEREDLAHLTIWDWQGDPDVMSITDNTGKPLEFQILGEKEHYWQHECMNIAIYCSIPSVGWRLILVDEDDDAASLKKSNTDPRVDKPYEFVLENEILHATIDPVNGTVSRLLDKRNGEIAAKNCGFSGLTESSLDWGTSWIVSRYKNDETPCAIDKVEWLHRGSLKNSVKVEGRYKQSKISYIISLDKGAEYLSFSASVDWLEPGSREHGVPHLRFSAECVSPVNEYMYDIPFGSIKRPVCDMDMPGQTYTCSCPDKGSALAIVSREKYAYRCLNDKMSLTLIRSSCDPDPFPELFRHKFIFYLVVPAEDTASHMNALSKKLCHPAFSQSVTSHKGNLPPVYSLLSSDTAVSGVKKAEDNSGDIIIRIYDNTGKSCVKNIKLASNISSAYLCSITETPGKPIKVLGSTLKVPVRANGLATVRIKM